MTMQVTKGPTLVNPEALHDVDTLRAVLHSANKDLLLLSQLRHMLEISVSRLGNDVADIATAYTKGDVEQLLQVAHRITSRVAHCHALARESKRSH